MMKRISVYFAAIIALTGCASIQTAPAKRQVGSFPEIGKTQTVSTGQVMVAKYDYLSLGVATLLAKVDQSRWYGRTAVQAGEKLTPAISDGQQIFCFPGFSLGAACFVDSNGSGSFDAAYTVNIYGYLTNKDRIPPAPYRIADQSIKDGFKYELLYEGVDNGVVRVAYREYTENVARPAFSQDLTYTLAANGPTQIKFREVSIKVLHADNTSIEYTVENGF